MSWTLPSNCPLDVKTLALKGGVFFERAMMLPRLEMCEIFPSTLIIITENFVYYILRRLYINFSACIW